MKKEYRVKNEQHFQKVFKNGKSIANKNFVLYQLPNNETHFRIGLSVGKKIGNAVKRNLMKRRLRAIFSPIKDQLKPEDILIIARQTSKELTYQEIKENIYHLLNKAQLLNKGN